MEKNTDKEKLDRRGRGKTTWMAGWNRWSPGKKVTEVHKHIGKYSVLVVQPNDKLEGVLRDAGGSNLLGDNRGYVAARQNGKFRLYREITERDCSISYDLAEDRFLKNGEKQPSIREWVAKISFGRVFTTKSEYLKDLLVIFPDQSVKLEPKY